jgi:CRISPR/Cas system endoribonuclease Cas6 (RAMP superfamily)
MEFIVQVNDRGISESPLNVSGYSAVATHVPFGYCNAFWFVMDKSLSDRWVSSTTCMLHKYVNRNSPQTQRPVLMHT